MNQTAIGIDNNHQHIWMTELHTEDGDTYWLGTGRNELLIINHDLVSALSYFIRAYPGTYAIQLMIEGKYEYIDLGEAAHKVLMDGIVAKAKGMLDPPEKNYGPAGGPVGDGYDEARLNHYGDKPTT